MGAFFGTFQTESDAAKVVGVHGCLRGLKL
jgi:hypothetical protein